MRCRQSNLLHDIATWRMVLYIDTTSHGIIYRSLPKPAQYIPTFHLHLNRLSIAASALLAIVCLNQPTSPRVPAIPVCLCDTPCKRVGMPRSELLPEASDQARLIERERDAPAEARTALLARSVRSPATRYCSRPGPTLSD